MRKILMFHPALAPYRVDFFNALAERFDLHLVLLGKNLQEQKFDQKSLVARLKCKISYLHVGFIVRSRYIRFGVTRFVRREKPDIVIGYEYSPLTIALVLYRMLMRDKYRLYITTDDNEELFSKCVGLRAKLRRFVLRHIDGCIVIDEKVGPMMKKIKSSNRLDVVAIPIVYDEKSLRGEEAKVFAAAEAWRIEHLSSGEVAVFFVGRMEPVKNLNWLIEAVANGSWPKGFKLFMVGDGSLRKDLERKVVRLGLSDCVVFLGRKEGFDLQILFAAADALVLCSISETFGAVVAESLQWGAKAFVSTHVGAKTIICEGQNGAVFALDDVQNLNTKLSSLLGNGTEWCKGRPSRLMVDLKTAVAKFDPR